MSRALDALATVTNAARNQETVISCISKLMELLVSTHQDLENELAAVKEALSADQDAKQQVVDALEKNVADLKAQLAAGEDTSATIAELEGIKALIKPVVLTTATDAPTAPAAPAVDPTVPPGETPVPS